MQVLVRVVYAGVNPVETYIREGQYSRLPDLPYTPGSDAAGYVQQVGQHVNHLKVDNTLSTLLPPPTDLLLSRLVIGCL